MRSLNSMRGFSLIELMVSVAIVGILSQLASTSFQNFKIRAKRVEALQNLRFMQTSIEAYRASTSSPSATQHFIGRYPYDYDGVCDSTMYLTKASFYGISFAECSKLYFTYYYSAISNHISAYSSGMGSTLAYYDTLLEREQSDMIESATVCMVWNLTTGEKNEWDLFPY